MNNYVAAFFSPISLVIYLLFLITAGGFLGVRSNLSKLDNKEYCISCFKEEISNKSIKKELYKKKAGSVTLTKISKEKRSSSRNTQKQRIKNYEDHEWL